MSGPIHRFHAALLSAAAAAFTALGVAACSDQLVTPEALGPGKPLAAMGTDPVSGASIETNKDHYVPGEVVHLVLKGWAPDEDVRLVMTEDPDTHGDVEVTVTVDGNGEWNGHFYDVEEHDWGVTFTLTATGLVSGSEVTVEFYDAAPIITAWTLNGGTGAITLSAGATITVSITATTVAGTPGGANWKSSRIAARPSSAGSVSFQLHLLACNDVDVVTSGVPTSATHSFTVTAPATAETYDIRIFAYDSDACMGAGGFAPATPDNNLLVVSANAAPTLGAIGNKTIAWGNALTFTAVGSDTDAGDVLTYYLDTPPTPPTGAAIAGTTGAFSWTPTSAQIGNHDIKVCVKDAAEAAACETITVTVTRRATALVYDGATAGQYSDKSTLSATLTDAGGGALDGDPLPSLDVDFTFDGAAAGTDATDANGQASVLYQVLQAAGSYTVVASFGGSTAYAAPDDATATFVVAREDATVTADADNPTSVTVTPGPLTSLALLFHVRESYAAGAEPDPNDGQMPGNINLVTLSATLYAVGSGGNVSGSCVEEPPPVGDGFAYARVKSFRCTFTNIPINTYEATAIVGGSFYEGETSDPLAVIDPTLGFISGGGRILLDGDRVNFGFSYANYGNAKKPTLRGSIVVIRHLADGGLCRIKSNQLTAPAISGVTASFSGQGNYTCRNAVGDPYPPSAGADYQDQGNITLYFYIEDNGEGANAPAPDEFWVRAKGLLLMNLSGVANAEPLAGGNIQVPKTTGKK